MELIYGTYYMVERFFEFKDAIKTTLALINKENLPVLTEEEWEKCNDLCTILQPFEKGHKKGNRSKIYNCKPSHSTHQWS